MLFSQLVSAAQCDPTISNHRFKERIAKDNSRHLFFSNNQTQMESAQFNLICLFNQFSKVTRNENLQNSAQCFFTCKVMDNVHLR